MDAAAGGGFTKINEPVPSGRPQQTGTGTGTVTLTQSHSHTGTGTENGRGRAGPGLRSVMWFFAFVKKACSCGGRYPEILCVKIGNTRARGDRREGIAKAGEVITRLLPEKRLCPPVTVARYWRQAWHSGFLWCWCAWRPCRPRRSGQAVAIADCAQKLHA